MLLSSKNIYEGKSRLNLATYYLRTIYLICSRVTWGKNIWPLREDITSIRLKCNYLFLFSAGKRNATLGKLFMIRVFEEFHLMGYEFVTSSDLTRDNDNSTLFFRKKVGPYNRSYVHDLAMHQRPGNITFLLCLTLECMP